MELETALTLLRVDPALFVVVRHIIETSPQALGTGPNAVFDGDSRTEEHVSDGVHQAADYARTFNQPNAYYFVYNVAKDTSIRFPGTPLGANSFVVARGDINAVCLVADLRRTCRLVKRVS